MAVPSVHLMLVSLNIVDEPVGYAPPAGPAVRFTVRYNQRDAFQPANFMYSNLGPKWTFDWLSYITDDPTKSQAEYYMGASLKFMIYAAISRDVYSNGPTDRVEPDNVIGFD